MELKQYSFPHWFDSSGIHHADQSSPERVSIPHWFDSRNLPGCRVFVQIERFNSTLVRFKASVLRQQGRIMRGFNSTLVRFKAHQDNADVHTVNTFQFHIGSIQGSKHERQNNLSDVVSIPHWFDSRASPIGPLYLSGQEFQFHIGSIQGTGRAGTTGAITGFQFHIGSIQGRSKQP